MTPSSDMTDEPSLGDAFSPGDAFSFGDAFSLGDAVYEAELRFTTHGVVHVRAATWAELGYGQGWAIAGDHLPTIADQIVKVRSERSRFHGVGHAECHLASDLGYLALGVVERAADLRAAQPPWLRDLVTGYVAGYNRRVDERLAEGSLPEWCRGAEWIRRIDELDLYAYLGDVALMGSGRNLAQLIGWAQAPGPDGPFPPTSPEALSGPSPASNGWAVGGDVTASGGGMVLANPHFPWGGEARFWECHLTIPGELDVYGVSLLGAPGVQMGFNAGVAWAHTFSKGHRFTVQQLSLGDGDPTTYRYGDQVRAMTSRTVAVDVLRAPDAPGDGALERVEREMWSTHHGPMLNMPLLGWGMDTAFCYRDANLDNTVVLEQFLGMCRARDLDEFRAVFRDVKGMPWVNTLAADRHGTAWYADGSATPALSEAATQRFLRRLDEDLIAALAFENRIAVLDGGEPDDEWLVDDDARSPGLVAPTGLPELEVRDVVVNANDSHWLSHPERRLEGYPVLCGLERTPRSLRTRQNLRLAAALARRGDVTLDDLEAAIFDNRSLSAELLVDAVVQRCRAASDEALRRAGEILAAWDRTASLDSVGAVLWREFMGGFDDRSWKAGNGLFAEPWDEERPLDTPAGLAPAPAATPASDGATDADATPDPILSAMSTALVLLEAAGVAPDAPLGAVQWAVRGDEHVAVPGGGEAEGLLNVVVPVGALSSTSLEPQAPAAPIFPGRQRTGLAAGGYQVTYGASFVMLVDMTPDGPVGRGVLAYGQSGDPASPHHSDGTRAFARGELRPLRFTDDEIAADPELTTLTLRSDDLR